MCSFEQKQVFPLEKLIKIKRALISVSNKAGILELAQELQERNVEIVSTGGSASMLRDAGFNVKEVSELTGFPEMMDGRLKTLHPTVHGGLLAVRDEKSHLEAMEAHKIKEIDLLIVNLYPFAETVKSGADYNHCIENIDIGGPAMIRAAAKNFKYVTTVVDSQDYGDLIDELNVNNGCTSYTFRQKLSQNAFSLTANYDAMVSTWMLEQAGHIQPRRLSFSAALSQNLRYGENPHQSASFYVDESINTGIGAAYQIQGKELSYNNINDADAALELVNEFTESDGAAAVIIKHANPCGVGVANNLVEAYKAALHCDTTSAFGGIVAVNQIIDEESAREITKVFTEVVIAPGITDGGRKVFSSKSNLRLLTVEKSTNLACQSKVIRHVSGGYLVQDKDRKPLSQNSLRVVTNRNPTDSEFQDMLFAWKVAKHVKSNAIVYAKDLCTVGIGAGQMSRVDSCMIAAKKAEDMAKAQGLDELPTQGSALASDAFFPFADGLEAAIEAGASSIIQPGGSIRDNEVINAANEAGLAMIFTGMRHFKH
ncbi:MAG: bifunctional phosphoribosylaminoimidazolecarboxamide formyltransferase/inosine monophosphate cyclohydrolase [Marinovum sp.]|nr:bifunctional phosphoribosylaminoimidazolecarboxamide formyltransferase/inosine monophosphate cyclohydrolase [Marinovum sp.]